MNGLSSSLFRLPSNPPGARTSLKRQGCSLNDVCLPRPLPRPLLTGPSLFPLSLCSIYPAPSEDPSTTATLSVVSLPRECHRVFIYLVFARTYTDTAVRLGHYYLAWYLTKKVMAVPFSVSTCLYHKKEHAAFFSSYGCAISPVSCRCSLRVDIIQGKLRHPGTRNDFNYDPPVPTSYIAIGISANKHNSSTW